MRLIDADALAEDLLYDAELCAIALDSGEITDRKELDRLQFEKDCKQNCVWYLTEAHTVDAVPVVRCRECKHYEEAKLNVITSHDKVCAYAIDHRFYREPDDFCSKGERKGGNE